jgi:hypothetical protein
MMSMSKSHGLSGPLACVFTAHEMAGKGPYRENYKEHGHPLGAEFAKAKNDSGVGVTIGAADEVPHAENDDVRTQMAAQM